MATSTVSKLNLVLAARFAALVLGGVGVVVGLFLFLSPSPSGSIVGWTLGYTLGTPATVEVPDACETQGSRGIDREDRTTCLGATWSVDGRHDSGTLYAQLEHVSGRDGLLARVDARVFNGAAYLAPTAGRYGATAALLALVGLGLVAAALSAPLWVLQRLNRTAEAADCDTDDVILLLVVWLATAATAGAAVGYLVAEDSMDRVTAGVVVAAAVAWVVWQVRKWRD